MAISNNIDAKVAAIILERDAQAENPQAPTPVSNELSTKAIAAILGGTQDWIAFVSLFATNDTELAKLIPTDGSQGDSVKREARAYLVANSMCTMGTGQHLKNNVTAKLD